MTSFRGIVRSIFAVICFGNFICSNASVHEADSLRPSQKQKAAIITGIGSTAIAHAGLYQLWYKDYPSSSFHFFNDNHEWLQMDKAGHCFSSYYLGLAGIEAAKWAGVPEKKQWKWALFGSIFQDPIELWDGLSQGWGASVGDLAANTFGTVLASAQHAMWKEQKVTMKYSFTRSPYARQRPNVLGSSLIQETLKDYNAQTYWLCYSPIREKKLQFLGLALGYGAEGMLGGEDNVWTDSKGFFHNRSDIRRYRQYYLSLDINLSKIKSKNKTLRTVLFILNCIKVPAPALEYSRNSLHFHWLKF